MTKGNTVLFSYWFFIHIGHINIQHPLLKPYGVYDHYTVVALFTFPNYAEVSPFQTALVERCYGRQDHTIEPG